MGYNPVIEVDTLSQAQPRISGSQQNNISLELAIARILNASVEEISEILKQVPSEKTGKIAIAIGRVWQEKLD